MCCAGGEGSGEGGAGQAGGAGADVRGWRACGPSHAQARQGGGPRCQGCHPGQDRGGARPVPPPLTPPHLRRISSSVSSALPSTYMQQTCNDLCADLIPGPAPRASSRLRPRASVLRQMQLQHAFHSDCRTAPLSRQAFTNPSTHSTIHPTSHHAGRVCSGCALPRRGGVCAAGTAAGAWHVMCDGRSTCRRRRRRT